MAAPVDYSGLTISAGSRFFRLTIPDLSRIDLVFMFFAWLHEKISLKTSIVAICASGCVPLSGLQVSLSLGEPSKDGDTPKICRLYLEQNSFVHDHFGN